MLFNNPYLKLTQKEQISKLLKKQIKMDNKQIKFDYEPVDMSRKLVWMHSMEAHRTARPTIKEVALVLGVVVVFVVLICVI